MMSLGKPFRGIKTSPLYVRESCHHRVKSPQFFHENFKYTLGYNFHIPVPFILTFWLFTKVLWFAKSFITGSVIQCFNTITSVNFPFPISHVPSNHSIYLLNWNFFEGEVLRGYCWLYIQKSHMAVFDGQIKDLEIKSGSAMCKAKALPGVLSFLL